MNLYKNVTGLFAAVVLPMVVVGCCCFSEQKAAKHDWTVDKGVEIQAGALPDPPGAHVRRFQAAQRDNAIAQEYAIFLHEWQNGGRVLGPYGEFHVRSMIKRLPAVPYPVLIQAAPDKEINEFRRNLIVAKLREGGIADADSRVFIRNPEAEGLFGDEAPLVYRYMLFSGLGMRGGNMGGGGGFGGGFGGGGFGSFAGGFGGGGFGGGFGGLGGGGGFGGYR